MIRAFHAVEVDGPEPAMRTSLFVALCLLLVASPAIAAKKRGPGKPTPDRTAESCKDQTGGALEACTLVGKYLEHVKNKRWNDAKKLTHPGTMATIAEVKKTTKTERHSMAPWFWEKTDFLVVDWDLKSIEESANGTWQVFTIEKQYKLEEDGHSEGEEAAWLLGKKDGVLYVTDVQRGGGGFDKTAITVGRKGFFDAVEKKEEAPKAE